LNTWRVLVVKFAMTLIISIIAFSFITVNPAGWVFFVAIAATAVNYLVGDLYVLPRFGNLTASIGDGVLGIVVAYIIGLMTAAFNPTVGSLLFFGVLIAVGEIFFHPYLLRANKVAPGAEPEPEHGNEHHGE
jgi:hypothetical protein